ncbi:hypothetical protein [Streptacidiphilus monticola]|uniref:Uncharacterized protein n=1 Tax=Streptacidiphilus monticola TaxID=2161674 RepID=A0ABW1G9T2_9ACTN
MSTTDELLVALAAMVESEGSNQMTITVVVPGAVITGRLAPERAWRERVAQVLGAGSEPLQAFASLFAAPETGGGQKPTHLHLHRAKILQGSFGLPHTGGMYRVAIPEVSAWTVGDLGYSDE